MKCPKCNGEGVLCCFCGKPPGNRKGDCECPMQTLMDHEAEHESCLNECKDCGGSGKTA